MSHFRRKHSSTPRMKPSPNQMVNASPIRTNFNSNNADEYAVLPQVDDLFAHEEAEDIFLALDAESRRKEEDQEQQQARCFGLNNQSFGHPEEEDGDMEGEDNEEEDENGETDVAFTAGNLSQIANIGIDVGTVHPLSPGGASLGLPSPAMMRFNQNNDYHHRHHRRLLSFAEEDERERKDRLARANGKVSTNGTTPNNREKQQHTKSQNQSLLVKQEPRVNQENKCVNNNKNNNKMSETRAQPSREHDLQFHLDEAKERAAWTRYGLDKRNTSTSSDVTLNPSHFAAVSALASATTTATAAVVKTEPGIKGPRPLLTPLKDAGIVPMADHFNNNRFTDTPGMDLGLISGLQHSVGALDSTLDSHAYSHHSTTLSSYAAEASRSSIASPGVPVPKVNSPVTVRGASLNTRPPPKSPPRGLSGHLRGRISTGTSPLLAFRIKAPRLRRQDFNDDASANTSTSSAHTPKKSAPFGLLGQINAIINNQQVDNDSSESGSENEQRHANPSSEPEYSEPEASEAELSGVEPKELDREEAKVETNASAAPPVSSQESTETGTPPKRPRPRRRSPQQAVLKASGGSDTAAVRKVAADKVRAARRHSKRSNNGCNSSSKGPVKKMLPMSMLEQHVARPSHVEEGNETVPSPTAVTLSSETKVAVSVETTEATKPPTMLEDCVFTTEKALRNPAPRSNSMPKGQSASSSSSSSSDLHPIDNTAPVANVHTKNTSAFIRAQADKTVATAAPTTTASVPETLPIVTVKTEPKRVGVNNISTATALITKSRPTALKQDNSQQKRTDSTIPRSPPRRSPRRALITTPTLHSSSSIAVSTGSILGNVRVNANKQGHVPAANDNSVDIPTDHFDVNRAAIDAKDLCEAVKQAGLKRSATSDFFFVPLAQRRKRRVSSGSSKSDEGVGVGRCDSVSSTQQGQGAA